MGQQEGKKIYVGICKLHRSVNSKNIFDKGGCYERGDRVRSVMMFGSSKSLIGRRVLIELASCLCQSSNSVDRCSNARAFSELEVLSRPDIDLRPKEGCSTSSKRPIL